MAAPEFSLVFLVVSLFVFVSSNQTKMEEILTNSINQFSTDFYRETVALNPGKNLIMSPISAEIALALLSLGARGNTLNELNTAMYLPNSDFTKTAFKSAISKLNDAKGVSLHIANKVFVMQNYAIASEYKKDAVDIFSSEVQSLDFAKAAESATTINKWVESKTNEKIKELISSKLLNKDTRMVLVNAIYFKGDWEKKFLFHKTNKGQFHLNSEKHVTVDMMHQSSKFNYAHLTDWKAKVLEMKYANSDMSMIIILPDETEGLKDVEEKMHTADLKRDVFDQMHNTFVYLDVPRFKIETQIDMEKVLPKLGINLIFNQAGADFSGLLQSNDRLYVSSAIQKAFIEVGEEGTEAAAATIFVTPPGLSFDPNPIHFTVDHQFLFLLKQNDTIIFSGRKMYV